MILVYIDSESRIVTLVMDKVVKTYPFSFIRDIAKEIEGKEVVYVSETLASSGDEVIALVEELLESDNEESIQNGTLYLRVTTASKNLVKHGNLSFYFQGMYDFKPLSSLPSDFTETCKVVSDGLKSGLFEIVNEQTKIYLEHQKQQQQEEKEEKIRRAKESRNREGSIDNPIQIEL